MKLSTVKKYKSDFFQALDGFLLMITQVLKHHNHCVISLEEVIQITMGSLKEDQSAPSSKHDDVQTGRILYISENAAEYLGHSMEDLLIHGDRLCHHPHQHKHQHHPQHHHQSISFSKCMIVIQICCSIYDIVDKQDHPTLHLHLARYHPPPPPHCHHFHHHQYHHHHCHHPHNHDDGQGGR